VSTMIEYSDSKWKEQTILEVMWILYIAIYYYVLYSKIVSGLHAYVQCDNATSDLAVGKP
jgi:hypothetical protein